MAEPTRYVYGASPFHFYMPAVREITQWVRPENEVPHEGCIVPIWDGEFIYYGVYWKKNGLDFWVVSENLHVNPDDMHMRKKIGEKIHPIQWMKIEPPTS